MPQSDRLLWAALAASTVVHVSLFWTPSFGWAADPPISTRDIAFLLQNMEPAGSVSPAGDPAATKVGPQAVPAAQESGPVPESPFPMPPDDAARRPAADSVALSGPSEPAPPSGAPAGAATPPSPPESRPTIDELAALGRLKALEEAAQVFDLDRPDREGPRKRYVDQVRDKISAQYFMPEAAKRQSMHGTVRIQAEVRRDGTIAKITYLERSDFPVLDAAAKLAVQRAAPFPSLEGVVDFETIRINIPIKY